MENHPTDVNPHESPDEAPVVVPSPSQQDAPKSSRPSQTLVSWKFRLIAAAGWGSALILIARLNSHETSVVLLCVIAFLLLTLGCSDFFCNRKLKYKEGSRQAFFHGIQSTFLLTVFFMAFFHGFLIGEGYAEAWDIFLRSRMPPLPAQENYPVIVIDTGELPMQRIPFGSAKDKETNLTSLIQFIHQVQLGEPNNWPKAIGIDLDFQSPGGEGGPLRSQDEKLLAEVRKTLNTVDTPKPLPISVAGFHSYLYDLDHRLSCAGMGNEVAAMDIPHRSVSRLYAHIETRLEASPESHLNGKANEGVGATPQEADQERSDGSTNTTSGASARRTYSILSLGQWLYEAADQESLPEQKFYSNWPEWNWMPLYRREVIPNTTPNNSKAEVFADSLLVDYRNIPQLRATVKTLDHYIDNPTNLADLAKKVVVLGDASFQQQGDTFRVPGIEDSQPGVYLHAALVATLLTHPMREVAPWAGLLLDVGLALFALWVLGTVHSYRSGGKKFHPKLTAIHPSAYFCAAASLPAALSVFLTRYSVLWPEAILVTAALLVHALFEIILTGTNGGQSILASLILVKSDPEGDESRFIEGLTIPEN